MSLSSDLISQFVKATKDDKKTDRETTVYGTVVKYDGGLYVKLDGSDLLTPVSTTADAEAGERVAVMIKNHSATITGNASSPSARNDSLKEVGDRVSNFQDLYADTLKAQNAEFENLKAKDGEFEGTLKANDAQFKTLSADVADFKSVTTEKLEAVDADIYNLNATYGEFKVLTAEKFEAIDGEFENLSTESLDAKYANIDFANIGEAAFKKIFSDSGIIKDIVVEGGTVTGELVGVTIKGDLIEGGTVVADKLVVKGTDGLYYKLNTDGMSVEAEQTEYNSLNGSIITAKSITATKISVSDLVAFGATIGGFHITDDSIYSGVKSSVGNTTQGIYLDRFGQIAFGDNNNYVKYYIDTDGNYKLAILASEIVLAATGKNIEDTIQDAVGDIDVDVTVGARNLIHSSTNLIYDEYKFANQSANALISYVTADPYGEENECAMFYITDTANNFVIPDVMTIGQEYTFSCWMKSASDGLIYGAENVFSTTAEWIKVTNTFTAISTDIILNFLITGTYYLYHPQLEIGNVATDWSPAPEDLVTADNFQDGLDSVNESITDTADRVNDAISKIEMLGNSMRFLITDGAGGPMLEMDANGNWTYCAQGMLDDIAAATDNINTLADDTSKMETEIAGLSGSVAELNEMKNYVRISTEGTEPSITLGNLNSQLAVRITNSEIDFVDNGTIPARINSQALHIGKAVLENELQIGGFSWVKRSNGNAGLIWTGG